jgi:hypothetical protein
LTVADVEQTSGGVPKLIRVLVANQTIVQLSIKIFYCPLVYLLLHKPNNAR